ncbi:MAG: hypothetical protein ABI806_15820 [Candidatus Solibacter sp.]
MDTGNESPMLPHGMYQSRLDDRGRLKLPCAFQEYFAKLGDRRVFVTSLDRRTARIYPISAWAREDCLTNVDDPEIAERIAFNAADLGGETEIDAQGRIVVPAELRRALAIEKSTVRLYVFREHVRMLSEAEFEQRRKEALESSPQGNA